MEVLGHCFARFWGPGIDCAHKACPVFVSVAAVLIAVSIQRFKKTFGTKMGLKPPNLGVKSMSPNPGPRSMGSQHIAYSTYDPGSCCLGYLAARLLPRNPDGTFLWSVRRSDATSKDEAGCETL